LILGERYEAAKLLGVSNAKYARHLKQQLRLRCMDGVHSFHSALKLAHS